MLDSRFDPDQYELCKKIFEFESICRWHIFVVCPLGLKVSSGSGVRCQSCTMALYGFLTLQSLMQWLFVELQMKWLLSYF